MFLREWLTVLREKACVATVFKTGYLGEEAVACVLFCYSYMQGGPLLGATIPLLGTTLAVLIVNVAVTSSYENFVFSSKNHVS